MYHIFQELEENLPDGVGQLFACERFKWPEDIAETLERLALTISEREKRIDGLRNKVREAYQARRMVEIGQGRKENIQRRQVARLEHTMHDDATNLRYLHAQCEESV